MPPSPPRIDAVVVAYNSAGTLRACVEPLAAMPGVEVTVVDNASPDDSLATVADLAVDRIRAERNGGFAAGCNLGIARGSAPYVLLVNPDARIAEADVAALAAVLDRSPDVGLVAPRILEADGSLAHNQRRFPRLRSTFAQAMFLHRVRPNAAWSDELIRDASAYERRGSPEWVSGACMLIRREALEQVGGGLDTDFFMYCEDIDLCARLREAGFDIAFEPAATVHHEQGGSGGRGDLLAVYARNRVLYARKHARRGIVPLEALGVALGHATHALASIVRPGLLRAHLRALAAVFRAPRVPAGRPEGGL